MLRIAHRGFPVLYPENSIVGFKKAIYFDCHYIEFDIRKTKDGVPVVMHDSDISRTTNGNGKVKNMTMTELDKFKLRDCGEPIPTLREVIGFYEGQTRFDIEIKSDDTARCVVNVVEDFIAKGVPYDDFLITSFKWDEILEVKKLDPRIPTGIIANLRPYKAVDFAIKTRSNVVVLHQRQVSRPTVKHANDHGILVFVYTVNDIDDIKRLSEEFGIDAIITDNVCLI